MQINPYLSFNGNCEEAFKFYEKTLGGKIEAMIPHEGTPAADFVPGDWRAKIMHARLAVDGEVIMGSDSPPQHQQKPSGFSVSINLDDAGKGKRIFEALSDGGEIRMPFQETFWAGGFGMVVDRFGTPWMVNSAPKAV
jgi:PhnB protein